MDKGVQCEDYSNAIVRRFSRRVKDQLTVCVKNLDPRDQPVHQAGMLIYKIFQAAEWQDLHTNGATQGAPIDITDGYVHFSTAAQAGETAAKHFAGAQGLMLLAVDADHLGADLKWEVSRGDALFPHLYRDLTLRDVTWAKALPLIDGTHRFPDDMT